MTKKLFSLLLSFILIFVLSSCANEETATDTSSVRDKAEAQSETVNQTQTDVAEDDEVKTESKQTEEQAVSSEITTMPSYKAETSSNTVSVESKPEQEKSDSSTDKTPVSKDNPNSKPAETDTLISREKAKSIALNHAGVTASDIYDFEIDFDADDGVKSYEIEFKTSKAEYDYDINAKTGEVIWSQKETKKTTPVTSKPVESSTPVESVTHISREKAKGIALNHAGVLANNIYDVEIELDKDDGVKLYEIEFKCDNIEYKYEISTETGKIINSEKDIDD